MAACRRHRCLSAGWKKDDRTIWRGKAMKDGKSVDRAWVVAHGGAGRSGHAAARVG
jgi:hypothetical protein